MQLTTFFATASKGIDNLLGDEIKTILTNFNQPIEEVIEKPLGISFKTTIKGAYILCLHSRLAHHILLFLDEFEVQTQEELYAEIQKTNWLSHIDEAGSLRIDVSGSHFQLNNTQFIAQKTKDAIVDQIREQKGIRPSIQAKKPDVVIHLYANKNKITVSLSLSGESLHKRSYRLENGKAPLKETLAAAILFRANWPSQILSDNAALIDPLCGSGTILIEAAMIAYEIAPGLDRNYFGFLNWQGHNQALDEFWQEIVLKAKQKRIKNLKNPYTEIIGFDIDPSQLDACNNNIKRAGLEAIIKTKRQALVDLKKNQIAHESGLIVTNPPYGERLFHNDQDRLKALMQEFGCVLKNEFINWHLSIFSANSDNIKEIGIRSHKIYQFSSGQLKAQLLNFEINDNYFMRYESEEEKKQRKCEQAYLNPTASLASLENRLKKNLKHLKKWAKRNKIDAFRLYDQDLPEYAFALDCYGDLIHIQEYQKPKDIDEIKAKQRIFEAIGLIKHLLDIPYESIHLKLRQKQKGKSQYERFDKSDHFSITKENKAKFYINLSDYLDSGLFLDHRLMRLEVAKASENKSLLNLFSYTCSVSVLASLHGAKTTTSVDMSNTYLNWAKENFKLNQIDLKNHEFIQADCFKWLEQNAKDLKNKKYDVIFLDPPTFSNSKRMDNTLDVQRDHVKLIELSMQLLKRNGILYFSNNYRRFKLDYQNLESKYAILDISHKMLPEDFKRRANIHHCFIFQQK